MTNELEKQFFQCFGIEPNCETRDEYHKHECYGMVDCDECASAIYPQITDRILLGIIAKIMWSYSCTQNDFDAYEVHTVDNLKEAVLKHAIELSKNDAYVYWGVRTLFEEG